MIEIKISDLVDAIDLHSDELQVVIHVKTGEIYFISDDAICHAEAEEDDLHEWQKEAMEIAKHYLENESDYLCLPTQNDVNEYRIMEDFVSDLEDEKMADQLLICLRGSGAFRRFKDGVVLLGIDKEWYRFRDERYKQFAIEWCEENKFRYKL